MAETAESEERPAADCPAELDVTAAEAAYQANAWLAHLIGRLQVEAGHEARRQIRRDMKIALAELRRAAKEIDAKPEAFKVRNA